MKRFYVTLLLSVASMMLFATEIDQQKAMEKARAFILNHKVNGPHRSPGLNHVDIDLRAIDTGRTELHAFNMDGGGFVIASGDDRTLPILGYSLTGSIDADNMPDNMRAWLQGLADEIKALGTDDVNPADSQEDGNVMNLDPVQPLLKTRWGDDPPYNLYTPVMEEGETSQHCAVGCVAIAMAQVMNYHQWPREATTTIPGYTYTVPNYYEDTLEELPSTTFQWDKMLLEYSEDTPGTEGQQQAVAELMQYCGHSVKMKYGVWGSVSYLEYAVCALRRYFNYSKSIYTAYRPDYTIDEWMKLIWNELIHQRPVIMGGESTSGAHAFILDGYDGNGLFHVNWGWNGKNNGYYAVSVLKPQVTACNKLGYVMNQTVIIGVEPSTDQEVPEVVRYLRLRENPKADETNLIYQVIYFDEEGKNGAFHFGLGVMNDDGTCSPVIVEDEMRKAAVLDIIIASFSLKEITLEDGDYKLYPIYKDADVDNDTWHLIGNENQFFPVSVKDGVATAEDSNPKLKIINAYFLDTDVPLEETTLALVVENQSDEEINTVAQLEIGKMIDGRYIVVRDYHYFECFPISLRPKERTTLTTLFRIPFNGVMEIDLIDILGDRFDHTTMTINKEPHYYDLELVDYKIVYKDGVDDLSEAITCEFDIKNNDQRIFEDWIALRCNDSIRYHKEPQTSIRPDETYKLIYPDELDKLDLYWIERAKVEGDAHIQLFVLYAGLDTIPLLDVMVQPGTTMTMHDAPTAIDNVLMEGSDNDAYYYDLCGSRLQGIPAKQGVYIKGRRKVIVK